MSEQTNGSVSETEENSSELITEAPDVASIRQQYLLPENWTDDEVILWLNKGAINTVTVNNGIFVYDPTRLKRPIHEWSTDELMAYVEGKLIGTDTYDWNKKTYPITDTVVIQELKRRISIDPAWNDPQILFYYRNGMEPAKTSNGVWVFDITRAKRQATQWSDAELIAWMNKEILAVGIATYSRLLDEAQKRKIKGEFHVPQ